MINSPDGLFTFGAEGELDRRTSALSKAKPWDKVQHSDSQEREEQIDCGLNEGDGIVALGTAELCGIWAMDGFQVVKKLTRYTRKAVWTLPVVAAG